MNATCDRSCRWAGHATIHFIPVIAWLVLTRSAMAQSPSINYISPAGGQRGTTVDVTLVGSGLAGVNSVSTDLPVTATIPGDLPNNGKDAGRVVVRVQIPSDAPVGVGGFRITTTKGISNLRLFAIDDLPAVTEKEPNNTREQAQAIAVNRVVVGSMEAENWDFYKFVAAAGEKLAVEVVARRLGSRMDPQIRLLDSAGRDVDFADDSDGIGQDCRIYRTFETAGEYYIEVRDVRYQGGDDAFYRLRLGEFPAAALPLPMAGKRGSTIVVTPRGNGTEQTPPVAAAVTTEASVAAVAVQAKSVHSGRVVPLPLDADVLDEFVEAEPNQEPAQANRVELPRGINGSFDVPGDVDRYLFSAKKDQRLIFETTSRRAGSPADLFLVLANAQGQELTAVDDAAPDDAQIDFKVPADGDYQLIVSELSRRAGPLYVYRVRVTPFAPGFKLLARKLDPNKTATDVMDVPAGAAATLLVRPVRSEYNGPIALTVAGLPPGLTASSTTIGPGQADTILTVTAAEDAVLGAARVRVVGTAQIDGVERVAFADVSEALSATLNALPYPPVNLCRQLGLSVSEKPFFTIDAKLDSPDLGRATSTTISVTAKRDADFKDPITLAILGVPANVDVAAPAIDKEKNEAKITLTGKNNSPLGVHSLAVTATGKKGDRQILIAATALNLNVRMPFDLVLDNAGGQIRQDGKLKVKARVTRIGGFNAAVELELKNLPKGVTAAKASIPQGANELEIELTAGADATVETVPNLSLTGTAKVGAENQTVTAPNVAISVLAK